MRKKKRNNILKSILMNTRSENNDAKDVIKDTAEAFNTFVVKVVIDLLKNGKFNTRTMVKCIESEDNSRVYNIKVNLKKIENDRLHIEYICMYKNDVKINYNQTYDSTSKDSTIIKDFENLTKSIVNLNNMIKEEI